MFALANTTRSISLVRHLPYAPPTAFGIHHFINYGPVELSIEPKVTFSGPILNKLKSANRIIASPSLRTEESAKVLSHLLNRRHTRIPVQINHALTPRNIGPWYLFKESAEKVCNEVPLNTPDYFKTVMSQLESKFAEYAPETREEHKQRIQLALLDIIRQYKDQHIVCVTHASCIKHIVGEKLSYGSLKTLSINVKGNSNVDSVQEISLMQAFFDGVDEGVDLAIKYHIVDTVFNKDSERGTIYTHPVENEGTTINGYCSVDGYTDDVYQESNASESSFASSSETTPSSSSDTWSLWSGSEASESKTSSYSDYHGSSESSGSWLFGNNGYSSSSSYSGSSDSGSSSWFSNDSDCDPFS